MIASMWDVPHVTENRCADKPEGKKELWRCGFRWEIIQLNLESVD
jgi:hypothetical protein